MTIFDNTITVLKSCTPEKNTCMETFYRFMEVVLDCYIQALFVQHITKCALNFYVPINSVGFDC